MEGLTVVVYGFSGNEESLRNELSEHFEMALKVSFEAAFPVYERTVTNRGFDAKSLPSADVCICFFDVTPNANNSLRFLLWTIDVFPYMPIVVVGLPALSNVKRAFFYKLRAAQYLEADAPLKAIAREAVRAYRNTWWWAIRHFDVPTMIVDPKGRVLRANDAARGRFGSDVVGLAYANAVEEIEAPTASKLPPGHPILEVLKTGRGVSRYREYGPRGPELKRAQLVCTPVTGLRNETRAVVVQVFDWVRWSKIFEAGSRLFQIDKMDDLCQAIVEQVGKLGYERARIYEFIREEKRLYGRASIGLLQPERENDFKRFSLDLDEDPISRDTLQRELPCLCYYKCVTQVKTESSDLVRDYDGEPIGEQFLERNGLQRWIEAPILVPSVDEQGVPKYVPWGKLSVDQGRESHKLDFHDIADMATFATIAGSAIAAVERLQRDRTRGDLFREYSDRLEAIIQQGTGDKKIYPEIMRSLLEMLLNMTPADAVFYRELRGQTLFALDDIPPLWRNETLAKDRTIPKEMRPDEGVSGSVLKWIHPARNQKQKKMIEQTKEELLKPFFNPDARETVRSVLSDSPSDRWTPEERRFLKFIGSEVYIPVVVEGNRLRGVLVAMAEETNAFSLDMRPVCQEFVRIASLSAVLGEMHKHHRLFRESSEQLATTVRDAGGESIMPRIVEVLLKMYLDMTGADVVFYREVVGESLWLRGKPEWRNPELSKGRTVPVEKRKGEGFSPEVFKLIKSPMQGDSRPELISKDVSPIFAHDARVEQATIFERVSDDRWSFEEREFMHFIGSEVCTPVVVHGNRLHGVLVAVKQETHGFSTELKVVLRPIMHTANLWLELGDSYDGRLWLDLTFRNIINVLPDLASAPSDDALFAGLATLLSAHNGLRWNRVMIFSCNCRAPQTAELVYALGGLGDTEEDREKQRELQERIENDPRVTDLRDFVRARIKAIAPHWNDDKGTVPDLFYKRCVEEPREAAKAIRVAFGADVANEVISLPVDAQCMSNANPLRWMLEQDYGSIAPFEIPRILQRLREGWLHHMNARYFGMFCAEKTYAFPLWCPHDASREPLGIVLVDMACMPGKRLDEIIPATLVTLDLIAGILASRYHDRRNRASVVASMSLLHGRDLKVMSDQLHWDLADSDQFHDKEGLVELAQQVNERINQHLAAAQSIQDRKVSGEKPFIADLQQCVTELVEATEERYAEELRVTGDWTGLSGVSLACDPQVFQDALDCLILNALSAAREANHSSVTVDIRGTVKRSVSAAFKNMITVTVTNSGPPIDPDVTSDIFLPEFSFRHGDPLTSTDEISKHTGRGLALARVQLVAYHGTLELEHPGGPDPEEPGDVIGPTFSIRFGILAESRRQAGGYVHAH